MAWFLDDRDNNRDVNDPETQCDIDVEHYNEARVTPDYSEAAKLCKLAAEQGHAPAQYNLGFMFEMGQGVEQDASEALKWYRAAADNGYAPAQLELGEMYESGAVGARDYGDAIKWYRLAADQGNADAQLRLGNMYREGQGVAQNHNEAAKWYRLAGEQEHSEAQYNLGRMYESGSIGAIDYEEAIKWYRLAADQGHPEAINELKKSEPKSIPEGVAEQQSHPRTSEQKSPKQPEPIPEEPSKITDPETQYEIGNKYYRGDGVTKDYGEAVKWFRLAAEQGNANAQKKLGWMHERGLGVPRDYEEAIKWYRLGKDKEHTPQKSDKSIPKQKVSQCSDPTPQDIKGETDPETQFEIGRKYYWGSGVRRDYNEAIKWFRLAADQGNPSAQYYLGSMYEDGYYGVARDYNEAVKWYKLAAKQGHANAKTKIQELKRKLTPKDNLQQKTHKSIPKKKLSKPLDPIPEEPSKTTDPQTQYEIGNKYYNGEDVALDYSEAIKWYRLAADQGNAPAINKLKEIGLESTPKYKVARKTHKPVSRKKVSQVYDTTPDELDKITDPATQFYIGNKYYSGNGVAQNYREAIKWHRLSADQGYAPAQYNLGRMYDLGFGVEEDCNEAVKWFRLAAQQGNLAAINKLKEIEQELSVKTDTEILFQIGNKYYSGYEVTRDYSEALKWYRRAAYQGHANAQTNLGNMYSWGCGVTQNHTEAVKWYRLAADQGDSVAQYNLGEMYEDGHGVTQDYGEAVKWYQLAAEQGHEEAKGKLVELETVVQQGDRPIDKPPSQNKPSHLDAQNSDTRLNEILDELNKLIGLEQVKKEIYQLIRVVRVQQMRSKEGLYSDDYHLNCFFGGSSGTGRTTVANIYAKMLHSMGVLSKGHLVKTSRQGLVAGDIHQTEFKTDAKIDEALGGILFIEQAHALLKADDNGWDYGQDVINILLRRIEEYRNDFVVILAGYPESMENLLESNEGLRSQFPTIVHFDDYSPGELLSMLNLFCLKANYELEPKAIEKLGIIIAEAYETGDMNLRNASFVRNLFDSLRKWQSVRIGETIENPTLEELKRISIADVELLKTNR